MMVSIGLALDFEAPETKLGQLHDTDARQHAGEKKLDIICRCGPSNGSPMRRYLSRCSDMYAAMSAIAARTWFSSRSGPSSVSRAAEFSVSGGMLEKKLYKPVAAAWAVLNIAGSAWRAISSTVKRTRKRCVARWADCNSACACRRSPFN